MDENNTYINKSEKEALEIMENVSDITSDQLQGVFILRKRGNGNSGFRPFPGLRQQIECRDGTVRNHYMAVINGLTQLKTPEEFARLRGKSVDEILG